MFLGTFPGPMRSVVRETAALWPRGDFYVPCCGNFTIERSIAGLGFIVHSSDVSIYTSAVGRWFTGQPCGIRLRDEAKERLAWLEPYLDDGVGTVATMMLCTQFLGNLGKPGIYWERQARAWVDGFHSLHAETVEKLGKANVDVASYDAVDVREWLEQVPREAPVCSFPPFYCLAPDERVLTADLRWVPCGELREGDHLLAFDQEAPDGAGCRRWQFATITRSEPAIKSCVRVHLEDGTSVVCTADHPWLAHKHRTGGGKGFLRWVEAQALTIRDNYVHRLLDVREPATSYDAGWLAGMFDGEDTFGIHSGARGSNQALTISQKPGPVADQASTRAWGSSRVKVVAVEPLGSQPIQSISTSTRTYIGEGFAMHNSGGYEKLYEPLDAAFTWDAPEYEVLSEDDVASVLGAIADRPYWLTASNQRVPELKPYLRGAIKSGMRAVAFYVYSSHAPARVVAPRQDVAPIPMPRLSRGDVVGDRLTLHPLTPPQFNAIRSQYMNPHIAPSSSVLEPCAVAVDGQVVGAFALGAPRLEGYCVYLMSDFAVGLVDYKRLSKLVIMAALSRETQRLAERRLSRRVTEIETTAFTHRPVSMKYRGLLDLTSRNKSDDPAWSYKLNYRSKLGRWTLSEALAEWKQKYADRKPTTPQEA